MNEAGRWGRSYLRAGEPLWVVDEASATDVLRQLLSEPSEPLCGLMMLTDEFASNCEITS